MVWITKREIAYYLILKQIFRDRVFNLGEAMDILTLFGSKHTVRKIMKILVSRGFLEKVSIHQYRVKDLESALLLNLKPYLVQRMYKRLKSLGLKVSLDKYNGCENIILYECDNRLRSVVDVLNKLIEVKCF